MVNPTGFLSYPRIEPKQRPSQERIKDFNEYIYLLDESEAIKQTSRCLDCGIPYCHALGCPLGNLIPEWNNLVSNGEWHAAYELLELTNNLPEITGRICPGPCEPACTLAINDSAVMIKHIELLIIETAFKNGWVIAKPPVNETGKRVAIIGSGPAGLSAAQQLRRSGHTVVVFEQEKKLGGNLRYGIPDFKLEKWVLDRRLEQMINEGISFETDVVIGEDISARYLRKTFDAVLLTIGAGEPKNISIPGRELGGIYFAHDYLKQANIFVAGESSSPLPKIISAKNKTVLVLGGGNTGNDCVSTALRQSAKQVYQYEIKPQPKPWDGQCNPHWPEWSNMLDNGSAHIEGGQCEWSIKPKKFSGVSRQVQQGHFVRVKWDLQNSDPKKQMTEITGSEFSLAIDLVILALGFKQKDRNKLIRGLEISLNQQQNVAINQKYATSIPGIFAAGDVHTGDSLVVHAIFHGREAAKAVDTFLRK